MVLQDLGNKLTQLIQNIQKSPTLDKTEIDKLVKDVSTILLQADVNVKIVHNLRGVLLKRLNEKTDNIKSRKHYVNKVLIDELIKLVTPTKEAYQLKKGKPNVVMFVGLQGSGKTTTCTKYAHYYNRKGWKTAIVCADTFRAGAFDQLKQNAAKVRTPFYGSYTEVDPARIAQQGVEKFKSLKCDLIIVDTSGRHHQELALFEEMVNVSNVIKPDEIIFVVDSHIGQASYEQAKAFTNTVKVGSIIMTKMDGSAKGGGALSAVAATGSPITFIGTGEGFNDFEPFEPKAFISKLIGVNSIENLAKQLYDIFDKEKQPEMISRLNKGIFTFRDMREHLNGIVKMGSFKNILGMFPGLSPENFSDAAEKVRTERVRKTLIILDSMTSDELDSIKSLSESRIRRIALGSGSMLVDVYMMVDQQKEFQKMVSRMDKSGLTKQSSLQNMMRNPSQLMNKVSQAVDSNILKNMGGAENMVKMMKSFQNMDRE